MSMQWRVVIPALSLLLVAGCGGGGDHAAPSNVTIGGTVTGLVGKLVLQNNAGDNLSVMANGAFTFGTPLNNGATYAVTVLTQPAGPTCMVANGSGTATANVTSVSVTCTTDPSTVFLPMSATAVPDSATPGATGLFVISSKSPGDPPIQITADAVSPLGLQTQNAVSAQGTVSAGNPYALLYVTINSTGDNHVWSLNLSGTSTLVPTQLSNLTIPYYTETEYSNQSPPVTEPVLVCTQQVIQKNLADPSSSLVILALPTDATNLCNSGSFKWVLVHASDGPTTDPLNLPTLSYPILPLYRPDGTLAGLVATDASNNLNFYADETFSNPRLLLANVQFYTLAQEGQAGPSFGMSVNPTYSFLLLSGGSVARGAEAVYRIDYSGTISADLYDLSFRVSMLVDSGNLYFTADTFAPTDGETVGRIPGDGGSAQILQSMPLTGVNEAPSLIGISGSNLVLSGYTVTLSQTQPYVAQSQSYIATVPTSAPGTLETIATNAAIPSISLVGGDIFVNWADFLNTTNFDAQFSSEILDTNGNILQSNMPSSSFISSGSPVVQVTNITDPIFLGGGSVGVLDLSQPSSPTAVALKTTAGMAFNFPSGTGGVEFRPLTSTIGVADGAAVQGQNSQPAYVYDLAKGVIVPISMSNSTLAFMTY
jgi:hypothetical protein